MPSLARISLTACSASPTAAPATLAIAIGGADGLTPDLRDRADWLISGPMVWPHMLFARVMLSEQLYRAATILAGGPYHQGSHPMGALSPHQFCHTRAAARAGI